MVVSLFAAAQWLEAQSLDRARKAIGRLLDLAPSECWCAIRRASGASASSCRSGRVDDRQARREVRARRHRAAGDSDVNQAPITGESLPVEKVEGDEVFAGTINGHGALTVAVTRRRADTTLARIVHLVESAQSKRAPHADIHRSLCRVVHAVGRDPVAARRDGTRAGLRAAVRCRLYRALVLLVVSCPCALVISTPVSIVSALAGAAQQGVLVKGGIHLERLAGVRVVAFDKTGTVTTGRLTLDAVLPIDGYSADDLLALAASVESQSEHPIAAAILTAARTRAVQLTAPMMSGPCPGSASKAACRRRDRLRHAAAVRRARRR